MLMWRGDCVVHDEFKGVELELMRRQHPDALVLVHPESPESVVRQAHVVGSTTQLLKAVAEGSAKTYIVATDRGIMHRMRQLAPDKTLLEAPTAGNSATCKSCAHCPWMAMNALQGLVATLQGRGGGEIQVPEPIRSQALGCIEGQPKTQEGTKTKGEERPVARTHPGLPQYLHPSIGHGRPALRGVQPPHGGAVGPAGLVTPRVGGHREGQVGPVRRKGRLIGHQFGLGRQRKPRPKIIQRRRQGRAPDRCVLPPVKAIGGKNRVQQRPDRIQRGHCRHGREVGPS
jgi:hypothetical protein